MLYKNCFEIIFSPTGGTKTVVQEVSVACSLKKEMIDLTNPSLIFHKYQFHKDDICYIGVPSFGGRVPKTAIERLRKMKASQTPTVLITTYGNRDYDDTLAELKECVEACGFHVIGAVAGVSEHSIMHQYGTNRPDTKDKEQLHMFGNLLFDRIKKDDIHELTIHVKGNKPYKEYHGVPLKPITTDACTRCGKCAKYCPVNAIPIRNVMHTNKNRCISCMRCIALCPQHARILDAEMVEATSKMLHDKLYERKNNELIY